MIPHCHLGKLLHVIGLTTNHLITSRHILLTCHIQLGWPIVKVGMFNDKVKTMGDLVLINNIRECTTIFALLHHYLM